jgi:hypothetical protein
MFVCITTAFLNFCSGTAVIYSDYGNKKINRFLLDKRDQFIVKKKIDKINLINQW